MQPPPPPTTFTHHSPTPFLFPQAHSTVLPDPSTFFSPHLLSNPLPTNSFFQNFVLKNGDQPEYIHPYLIKSSKSSLSLSYPSLFKNSSFIYQIFIADLIISTLCNNHNNKSTHMVSSFNDLSVTLDFPSSNLRFYLVRGSPFLTCNVQSNVHLSISTAHTILKLTPNSSFKKYTINLNNTQIWLLYASSPIKLSFSSKNNTITSSPFSGVIRLAVLPNKNPESESTLDRFSSCYPVSGEANLIITKPFHLEYNWEKKGSGDGGLLMLAHPLHLRLLSHSSVSVLEDFKYNSIDGELVGVVGDSWVLKTDPVSVNWHSINGVEKKYYPDIIRALINDTKALNSSAISTNSSYFYGKLVARAARLALIAEEVSCLDVIPTIKKFLKDTIEPWLDSTFKGNGFLYDKKWGGLVTKQGSLDSQADFGFGIFNDHHFHLGYFIYGISVLANLDPEWGRKYEPQAYAMVDDYTNLRIGRDSHYAKLRMFDFWKLHSWAAGLNEFENGRNQESTSEALNAYYSTTLMGLAYNDKHLVSIGNTISAFEMKAAQTWWHVKKDGYNSNRLYPKEFTKDNRVVGILWANKRDSALWFVPAERRDCRLGIQLLPVLPISEVLFSDVKFVKELVEWAWPALGKKGVEEGWKGFAYALQGVYDKEEALENIGKLTGYDDGNSLTNLLWWVYSRGHGGGRG
ncbi:hypothetical protein CASFOL_032968 [Castilleja foliolosa]|uniref:glucan endo-1,3-beta-D-glucosidase n=1 Tax=Castilleja foliolosa TaxID=1961234 RepID=A0ABD3C5S3_9LAMI